MFKQLPAIIALFILALFSCTNEQNSEIKYRPIYETFNNYPFPYTAANWEHPDYTEGYTSFGNHRFHIRVNDTSLLQRVIIPCRRSDIEPEKKAVAVVAADSGNTVVFSRVLKSDNDVLDLVFANSSESDNYYVYYLPHRCSGGYYPTVDYLAPGQLQQEILPEGVKEFSGNEQKLSMATVVAEESIDEFNSFFPMELVASKDEVAEFLSAKTRDYYLFPEYRHYPIRMRHFLPYRWMNEGINGLDDKAKRGEYYTFQVGIYSELNEISDISIEYSDLKGGKDIIKSDRLTCFNTEGVDLEGKSFSRGELKIEKNTVQPLWFGIDIPESARSKEYSGYIRIQPDGLRADTIYLRLEVTREEIDDHGDNNPENMSRLRWLNSSIGIDNEYIIEPFLPVESNNDLISILGRKLRINESGLPADISSFFSEEMTFLKEEAEEILAEEVRLNVIDADGELLKWQLSEEPDIQKISQSTLSWSSLSRSELMEMLITARAEYDGMLDYQIQLVANGNIDLRDINLSIPLLEETAEYMLGLGYSGRKFPGRLKWKWNVKNHQEGVWLGTINKGLQYVLRDNNYERPLNTNFYQDKPLNLPESWYNKGKGGIEISTDEGITMVKNYSGPRKLNKGDTLNFNIRFLITPFKLIDLEAHFNTRFVHKYIPVDSVISHKGTVVNVHHANEINPYINYPFYNTDKQKAYIDEAHKKGIKVKLYNTIRELSYRSYELFALRSMGDEILNTGKGGGHSWLQEHMRSDYYSAWHATRVNDAAILNKGNSRWTNYYIEGINWLAANQGMDGLYLDDIAFSRSTVKRIANVLSKNRGDYVIDLHSANQFNEKDGFINSAFLYMEHFPYISRLWFGEYFDYYASPDYWFTEVSGLPFGLTGEMLQDGGRPYHGLIYGMTTRVYGKYDPSGIWKLFDDFGIADSKMLGYWVDHSPVSLSNDRIKSTVYVKDNKILMVLASWSENDEEIDIVVDRDKVNIDFDSLVLYAPQVDGLQEYRQLMPDETLTIKANSGLILILESQ